MTARKTERRQVADLSAAAAVQLRALSMTLRQRRHRGLLWLTGERSWCLDTLPALLDLLQLEPAAGYLIGDRDSLLLPRLSGRQAGTLLGQTLPWVAIDAYGGFNPNTVGLLAGCISAGGWLVLLSPLPTVWSAFDDPEYRALCVEPWTPQTLQPNYLERLVRLLGQASEVVQLVQNGDGLQLRLPTAAPELCASQADSRPVVAEPTDVPWRSEDQRVAVEQIVLQLRRRAVALVLTADRGRGKTAAMGLALAHWTRLQPGKALRVLVTAPTRAALQPLFERLQAQGLALQWSGDECRAGALRIHWYTPDDLRCQRPPADLLMIDEAAALPTPLLAQLSQHYSRLLFSTTQHGYEGNGRGFTLRFLAELDRLLGGHTELRLQQPIRWGERDPLEAVLNRVLLLDAEPEVPSAAVNELADPVPPLVRPLSRAALAGDETCLRQLFGLLILAHYRTTPGDLRVLLDSPNLRPWVLEQRGQPLGCALVAAEGELSDALAEGVWQGVRRPTGHLLPQALIAHEGWSEVASMRAWRIVRIAVHPQYQQAGLGGELLRTLLTAAQQDGVDYVGASFAATPELLRFWQREGFWPLRVGDRHDPVSGSHSVLVVCPLSMAAQRWFEQARAIYVQRLRWRLQGTALARLPLALLPGLFAGCPLAALSRWQYRQLQGFATLQRSLESCLLEFAQLIALTLPHWPRLGLDVEAQQLLIARVWRQQGADAVTQPAGRRAQLERLRPLCGQLLALIPEP